MIKRRKGLFIQFFGLPNSGKYTRITNLENELTKKYPIKNIGNLGGFSLEKVIEEPYIYYEFDFLENKKPGYEQQQKTKEATNKIIEELRTYKELFEKEIEPELKQNKIVMGYNPIHQNLLYRSNIITKNSKKALKYIEKLHDDYNQLNFYLDATPKQVLERQPKNYEEQLIKKRIRQERKRKMLNSFSDINSIKEIDKRIGQDFKNISVLKDIYKTSKVLKYFFDMRTILKNYSKQNNVFEINHSLDQETHDEIIYSIVTKTIKTLHPQPKSL